ncbi:DUF4031 domain-containing protein [Sphingomonas sp. A2-49]|uniref:DUF4031 domain-containing protein n=1 Tax=Sphingomonas sp. A2-49 TaxID=1391375 RepID=UPI0021D3C39F|nr:DUF4031 domain-containing protein [Sphingomonas sp. A2-49]MCU6454327.1 DUF4031 domain-containing protein [Sphingomonas sp. A2-49]
MTVYVDDVRHRFGRMVMCHMWADTTEELHAAAQGLGLRRSWFQAPPKASWEHYDISLSVKAQAIANGAILTDKYGPVEHTSRLRLEHENEVVRLRAREMLDRVAICRAQAKQDRLL